MLASNSALNLINLIFISAGIGICGLCLLQITASMHLEKTVRGYFQLFFALLIGYMTAHLARQLMNGLPGEGFRDALYVVTFVELFVAGVVTHVMSMLVLISSKAGDKEEKLKFILLGFLCGHTIALIITSFTESIYYFDEGNLYHRGPIYLLSNLFPLLMMATDMAILVKHKNNFDRRVRRAFWIYMIVPLMAIIIQSAFYGIQFIILSMVCSAVYMFSVIIIIQNESFAKQQVESSQIETELAMASGIQADLLANLAPVLSDRPEFSLYGLLKPAKEVSGDFYEYFMIDEDHLYMAMVDVSGKGVPAALFMLATKIILANNAMMKHSPGKILTFTNAALYANNQESMFARAWVGILELSTGKLVAANAGQESPALRKAGGTFEIINDEHGIVLGGKEWTAYNEYEIMLKAGEKLFIYTDGVPRAIDSNNEFFGSSRMLVALNKNPMAPPEVVIKNVQVGLDIFAGDEPQTDDVTMLCLEYKGHKK